MHFAYGGLLSRADDKWWLGNEAKHRRRAWAPTGHRADWEGKGLSGWKDLQIVMPRKPVDQEGNSLVPEGTDVKVIRHFPLAD